MGKKTIDYKKWCWSCGGPVADKGRYYECEKCGATFTDIHTPAKEVIKTTYYHNEGVLTGHHWEPNIDS